MLSVIIPVWCPTPEHAHTAERCVTLLRGVAQIPTEIITVVDGSPHHARLASDAGIIFPTNRGIAPAWNWGAQNSRGDLLAFVTMSTAVEAGWDTALSKSASEGCVAFPLTDEGDGVFQKHRAGTGIAGWCWMIPRRMYEKVGPFDEAFVPSWYEDTDWFHRAHLTHGFPLVSVPSAHVYHAAQSTTRPEYMPHLQWLHLSQRFRYAWKHGLDNPLDAPPFWKQPIPDWKD